MEGGLAEDQVEKRGIVGLDDEKEDFFCGNSKERRANDGTWRIGPYSRVYQVRVPWRGRDDGDLSMISSVFAGQNQSSIQL